MPGFDSMPNPEKPYSSENLPYWLEYLPDEFILAILREMARPYSDVEGYTKILLEAPDIQFKFGETERELSSKEICEKILMSTGRMREILELAHDYARGLEKRRKNATAESIEIEE